MFSTALSMLSTAKGAVAAAVIASAAIAGGAAAAHDAAPNTAGDTDHHVSQPATEVSPSPMPAKTAEPAEVEENETDKPADVAARNDAVKALHDAFKTDQKALEKLHSTKIEGSREGLAKLVNDADKQLRARMRTALNDVAALTVGTENDEDKDEDEDNDDQNKDEAKPAVTPETQAEVDAIVAAAIADMQKIVTDTTAAVAALPAATPKPTDNKDKQDAKAGEKQGESHGDKGHTATHR